jgi:hypothetical protein
MAETYPAVALQPAATFTLGRLQTQTKNNVVSITTHELLAFAKIITLRVVLHAFKPTIYTLPKSDTIDTALYFARLVQKGNDISLYMPISEEPPLVDTASIRLRCDKVIFVPEVTHGTGISESLVLYARPVDVYTILLIVNTESTTFIKDDIVTQYDSVANGYFRTARIEITPDNDTNFKKTTLIIAESKSTLTLTLEFVEERPDSAIPSESEMPYHKEGKTESDRAENFLLRMITVITENDATSERALDAIKRKIPEFPSTASLSMTHDDVFEQIYVHALAADRRWKTEFRLRQRHNAQVLRLEPRNSVIDALSIPANDMSVVKDDDETWRITAHSNISGRLYQGQTHFTTRPLIACTSDQDTFAYRIGKWLDEMTPYKQDMLKRNLEVPEEYSTWEHARLVLMLHGRLSPDLLSHPTNGEGGDSAADGLWIIAAWRELSRGVGASASRKELVAIRDAPDSDTLDRATTTIISNNDTTIYATLITNLRISRTSTWSTQWSALALGFDEVPVFKPNQAVPKRANAASIFLLSLQVVLDVLCGVKRNATLDAVLDYAQRIRTRKDRVTPIAQVAVTMASPPFFVYPVRAAREFQSYGTFTAENRNAAWLLSNREHAPRYDFLVLDPQAALGWVLRVAQELVGVSSQIDLKKHVPGFRVPIDHWETGATRFADWLPPPWKPVLMGNGKALVHDTSIGKEHTADLYADRLYRLDILPIR